MKEVAFKKKRRTFFMKNMFLISFNDWF